MVKMKNIKFRQVLLPFLILILASSTIGAISAVESLPGHNNIYLNISNDHRYGEGNSYFFFDTDLGGGGGMNALKMRGDNATHDGQIITTNNQSGEFYIGNGGGKGWQDNFILMVALNGTLSENFKITITSFGYVWDSVFNGETPGIEDVEHKMGISETFGAGDFLYNSTWKPGYASDTKIFTGQDVSDLLNMFSLMFIDLHVGGLGSGTVNKYGEVIPDNGMCKIEYEIEELEEGSSLVFNIFGYDEFGRPPNIAEFVGFTNNPDVNLFTVVSNIFSVNSAMTNEEIQSFINNLSSGSTIKFLSGNYENLTLKITKQINIVADGIVNIIGNGTGIAFDIDSDNVNIGGFNIDNYDTGIKISGNNTKTTNNNISDTNVGINASGNNNAISKNQLTNNSYGIATEGNNVSISNNDINKTENDGIWTRGNNTNIENNAIENSGNGIVVTESNNANIKNNNIKDSKNYGIKTTTSAKNAKIESNTIEKANYGIETSGEGNTIKGNKIKSSKYGISTATSSKNTKIESNTIEKADYGIVASGESNTIKSNTIKESKYYGINLKGNKGTVSKNNIINSGNGITIQSNSNKIESNTISNGTIGIQLKGENNQLIGNNIISTIKPIDNQKNTNTLKNNEILNKGEWTISSDMDNNFIQSIINKASSGNMIKFQAGQYKGLQLNIPKSLKIYGEKGTTLIGLGYGTGFSLKGNNIILNGFTITNYSYGIINYGTKNTITKNTITKNKQSGILNKGSSNKITKNIITKNLNHGLYNTGKKNTIQSNKIYTNKKIGLYNKGSSNKITKNMITKNLNHGLYNTGKKNTIQSNKIYTNKKIGLYNQGKYTKIIQNTIRYNAKYGIYYTSKTNKLQKNIIKNNKKNIVRKK